MWGAIAGLALGAAGSIYSGIQSRKANKQRSLYLDEMERDAINDHRRSLVDGLQTASQQMADTNTRKLMLDELAQTDAMNVVQNGTGVGRAQALEKINQGIATQQGAAAVDAQNRRDRADEQYRQQMNSIRGQRIGIAQEQANANAQAGAQVANAGMQIAAADIAKTLNGKAKPSPSSAEQTPPEQPAQQAKAVESNLAETVTNNATPNTTNNGMQGFYTPGAAEEWYNKRLGIF